MPAKQGDQLTHDQRQLISQLGRFQLVFTAGGMHTQALLLHQQLQRPVAPAVGRDLDLPVSTPA